MTENNRISEHNLILKSIYIIENVTTSFLKEEEKHYRVNWAKILS